MCRELDEMATTKMADLDDTSVRDGLLDLVAMANRCFAETLRRVDAFDTRGLSADDGFRTARTWLIGALGVAPATASRWVKTARLLRHLPKLSAVLHTGTVSQEHVQQVIRLADRIDLVELVQADPILAEAAPQLDVRQFEQVCRRIEAHVNPDGRDPAADFERRSLRLSPAGGLVALRGQLDPEGAAALQTALDALMPPPAEDDLRRADQRRADALVDLARLPLATGDLPATGGQRPQIGITLWPQALSPETLTALADAQTDQLAAARLREYAGPTPNTSDGDPTADTTPGSSDGDPAGGGHTADGTDPAEAADPAAATPAALTPLWSRPGWADPPQLSWFRAISPELAQRIACDADVFRVILDPAGGMPLDVGRSHRLVPYWIRKALYIRDRGCRWTGCHAPPAWCDAHHHRKAWADGGGTSIEDTVLLCRYHHMLVHEGGWGFEFDHRTGQVQITRPGGIPYLLPRGRSPSPTGPTTHTT